jgi:hypothetical protein
MVQLGGTSGHSSSEKQVEADSDRLKNLLES